MSEGESRNKSWRKGQRTRIDHLTPQRVYDRFTFTDVFRVTSNHQVIGEESDIKATMQTTALGRHARGTLHRVSYRSEARRQTVRPWGTLREKKRSPSRYGKSSPNLSMETEIIFRLCQPLHRRYRRECRPPPQRCRVCRRHPSRRCAPAGGLPLSPAFSRRSCPSGWYH